MSKAMNPLSYCSDGDLYLVDACFQIPLQNTFSHKPKFGNALTGTAEVSRASIKKGAAE